MNTNEFKLWLEGFVEGKEALNKTDMEVIQEKLSQAMPVLANPYPVYTPTPNYPQYDPYKFWYTTGGYGTCSTTTGVTQQ